jgi:hypothetical protein
MMEAGLAAWQGEAKGSLKHSATVFSAAWALKAPPKVVGFKESAKSSEVL